MAKSKQWKLDGPRKSKFTLLELAALLGYDGDDTVRRLITEGWLPPPRGHGQAQFYTGLDVAIILEMFGRWGPRDGGEKSRKPPQEPANRRKPPQDAESET